MSWVVGMRDVLLGISSIKDVYLFYVAPVCSAALCHPVGYSLCWCRRALLVSAVTSEVALPTGIMTR